MRKKKKIAATEEFFLAIHRIKLRDKVSQARIGMRAGIIESRLSRISTGKINPKARERRNLAKVLGVPEENLFNIS